MSVLAEVTGKCSDIHERGHGDEKQHYARIEIGQGEAVLNEVSQNKVCAA